MCGGLCRIPKVSDVRQNFLHKAVRSVVIIANFESYVVHSVVVGSSCGTAIFAQKGKFLIFF